MRGPPWLRSVAPLPVAAAAGAVAASLLGDQMLYVVMSARPEAWGLSAAAVGVLLSANRFVRLASNPLAAVAVNRWGWRGPFAMAMVLAVAVTLVYGWATAFWVLLLARMGWGTAWSALRLGGQWTVLDAATDDNRGLLMGSYSAITRLGGLGGAVLGGVLTDAIGHEWTLTIFAAAIGLAGLGWYGGTRHVATTAQPPATAAQGGLSEVLRDAPLLVVSMSGLLIGLIFAGVIGASLGFLLREQYGEEISLGTALIGVASFTGLLIGLRGLLNIATAPLAGAMSDRIGRVRGTTSAMIVAALGTAALAVTSSVWLLVVVIMVTFAASTATLVQLQTAAGDLARPERRAAVLSTYSTFQDLGAAIGPLLGLSWGTLGALQSTLLVCAVVLLGAAFIFRSVMQRAPSTVAAVRG
jgi:MFS family permease